jgi:replication factor A1
VPDGSRLRSWWAATGGSGVRSISDQRGGGGAGGGGEGPLTKVELRYPVAALRDEHLAQRDPVQGALAVVKASIMTIRADPDKLWYPACPQARDGRTCNKKLTDNGGMWACNACGEVPAGPSYRYIMSAQLSDASGANYVTLFDAEATAVVGKDANTLHAMVAASAAAGGTNAELESIMREATFKEYLFSVKVKMETVRDEQRVKGTVVKVRPLDYAREARVLLEGIKKYQPVLR